jgi:glycerophosphoryl diester phosphodiesterase
MRIVGLFAVAALLAGACGGSEKVDEPILPSDCLADPQCQIPFPSAHRGLCGGEPENTLSAYFNCERLGVPLIELDTQETSDGAVVIMHDGDVERTTDGETRFPGRTGVGQLTLEEFKSLVIDDSRCRADPDADPDRCHPTTFLEVLQRTDGQTLFDVDFKDGDAAKLAEVVQGAGAAGRILLFDSNVENLRAYRSVIPDGVVMPRAASAADVDAFLAPEYDDLDLRWIHGDPPFAAEVQDRMRQAGVRFYCNGWDGEDPVDIWIVAAMTAETAENQELAAEYWDKAWRALDKMLNDGVRALGTDFAQKYVEYLYPNGFGKE